MDTLICSNEFESCHSKLRGIKPEDDWRDRTRIGGIGNCGRAVTVFVTAGKPLTAIKASVHSGRFWWPDGFATFHPYRLNQFWVFATRRKTILPKTQIETYILLIL